MLVWSKSFNDSCPVNAFQDIFTAWAFSLSATDTLHWQRQNFLQQSLDLTALRQAGQIVSHML